MPSITSPTKPKPRTKVRSQSSKGSGQTRVRLDTTYSEPTRRRKTRPTGTSSKREKQAKVSPTQRRALVRHFGNHTERLLDLVEMDDHDGYMSLTYRSILQMLIRTLPMLEKSVKKSKGTRGAYQLNQTIAQLRETLADVQTMRDRGKLGEQVVNKHVRPGMLNVAQQVVMAFVEIEGALRNVEMSKTDRANLLEKLLPDLKRGLSVQMNEQFKEILAGVSASLS